MSSSSSHVAGILLLSISLFLFFRYPSSVSCYSTAIDCTYSSGGNNYDFSSIGYYSDLTWSGTDPFVGGGPITFYINPCGVSHTGICTAEAANNSFCVCTNSSSTSCSGVYDLDDANTGDNPVYSTIHNGVEYEIADGETIYCANNQHRTGVVAFLCNLTSINPIFLNVTEAPECTYTAYISTYLACPSARGIGDPSFVGIRGQKYQVHGIDAQVYSIISDSKLQVNARFSFLASGRCPQDQQNREYQTACWSHPGSYLRDIAIQTDSGQRLLLQAGDADIGFTAITLNGKILSVSESSYEHPDITITYTHRYRILVSTPIFSFEFINSDHFINIQSVRVLDMNALQTDLRSHGILGQTWRSKPASPAMEVSALEGYVDDYAEANNDLWGTDTRYNRFQITQN